MALAFKNHLGWSQEDRSKYISWQLAGECISTCVSIRFHFPTLYTNCYINISTVSYSFSWKKKTKTGVAASEMLGLCSVLEEEDDCSLIFLGRGFTPTNFFFLNELYNFFNFFFCLLLNCWGGILCWTLKSSFLVAFTWTCLTLTCQSPPG